MHKIYYIMGKSSSGKDTIYKKLSENKKLNLKKVVLYTTRPVRDGETQGKEYFFVSTKELEDFEKANKIIEKRDYSTVHGKWTYFTAEDGQIDLTQRDYLIMGTLESYNKIKKYYKEESVIPIYIEVEDGLRLERALKREKKQKNPKYQELCRRFLADAEDFSEKKLKESGIRKRYVNNDLEQCLSEIIYDITGL